MNAHDAWRFDDWREDAGPEKGMASLLHGAPVPRLRSCTAVAVSSPCSASFRSIRALKQPRIAFDAERVAEYLRDTGALFRRSPMAEQRRFVREVFEEILVEGEQVTSIRPRPIYEPYFIADRHRRFNGDMGVVVWLPGQDSNLQPCG